MLCGTTRDTMHIMQTMRTAEIATLGRCKMKRFDNVIKSESVREEHTVRNTNDWNMRSWMAQEWTPTDSLDTRYKRPEKSI